MGTKLVYEFLLVNVVKNVNTVDKLEKCTEVCGLDSSELVECCVLSKYRLEITAMLCAFLTASTDF